MGKQWIFCVESTQQARTDWTYINEVVKKYIKLGNELTYKPIYMSGKGNYVAVRLKKKIRELERGFIGTTTVIMCTDTDRFENDPNDEKYMESVRDYCRQMNYKYVWFCHDVDEVFWGKSVSNSEKTNVARNFATKHKIAEFDSDRISYSDDHIHAGGSNLLYVLNGLSELLTDDHNRIGPLCHTLSGSF